MREVDCVLHDVAFFIERGRDVDGGVGDDERFSPTRHVHDEAVAHAPLGTQAGGARDHGAHQLVRVQRAFHQCLRTAFMHELHRAFGSGMAMRRIDDGQIAEIEIAFLRGRFDFRARADQYRRDQFQPRGFDDGRQRIVIARMRDGRRRRRKRGGKGDQTLVFLALVFHLQCPRR